MAAAVTAEETRGGDGRRGMGGAGVGAAEVRRVAGGEAVQVAGPEAATQASQMRRSGSPGGERKWEGGKK